MIGLSTALTFSGAMAEPQASVGLTAGGGISGLRQEPPFAAFHMGARGSVLFGRARDDRMAVGPYAEVVTVAFESLELGGGVEWLIPVFTGVPFVLSAGGHARYGDQGWEPGVSSTLFVGSRSYNRGSVYGFALGLFVQGRYAFDDTRQGDVLLGAYVDVALFAVPFVVLVNAFR